MGIKIEYFKKYIEFKFKPGMSWSNYGKVWHLDHIIPVSIIDISNEKNLKFAFNYRNLQPLFAKENLSKSNKVFISWESHMKIQDIDYHIKNILKRCHPEQQFDIRIINNQTKKGVELIFQNTFH